MSFVNMEWISAIGTAAFAFSGYLMGVKKQFDLLGILIVSTLTAIGGGIIRDVMISRVPLVFYDYTNIIIVALTLLIAWLARLHHYNNIAFYRLFIIADSLGLVSFSLTGAQVGITLGLNAFGVVLLGFVSAVGGGILRDTIANDIPFILYRDFYGVVAILVAAGLLTLHQLLWVDLLTLQLLLILGVVIRLLAHWRDLALPKIDSGS